jgi:hypothetical protein
MTAATHKPQPGLIVVTNRPALIESLSPEELLTYHASLASTTKLEDALAHALDTAVAPRYRRFTAR